MVSRHDLEGLLVPIAQRTADPRAGIYGPGSASWKINREAALFLGAGRAALLQLAHPWVVAALAQHSNVMSRPIVRFHNTFRIVFAVIFGSLDQALAASRHLHTLHTRIEGNMPESVAAYRQGSHYQANEIAALRWVHATLIETAVVAYEWVMPPLTPAELAAFYADSQTLAAMFGIPAGVLPVDWPAFLAYCRQMEQSNELGVNEKARSMGHNILAGAGSWIRPPHWYRALTAQWMPERFREEFALSFGPAEQRATESARRRVQGIYRRLPAAVRFVGPWHEAQARLRGRRVGMLTRANTRFWIGQARLPFADGLVDVSSA
jgi:uncharacterized protein (DUF2236 family)